MKLARRHRRREALARVEHGQEVFTSPWSRSLGSPGRCSAVSHLVLTGY